MTGEVITLPRPKQLRAELPQLGFYVRVGRNDHREILELIAAGERGPFGFVIDAVHVGRHKALMTEIKKWDFDLVLDPKTQQMGMPGSYNDGLIALPWGTTTRHHTVSDFDGQAGEVRVDAIVDFAVTHGFTQVLGPSHLIVDPNDAWLQRDIAMMSRTADRIQRIGAKLGLIYSLALPMNLLRDDARRSAVVTAISKVPCDAVWLKVENFGDDATGEKTVAYISACRDFHERGIPVVGDHVGGLPGLGALAFGAVGGIAHGVTVNQSFAASSWRRSRRKGGGGQTWRVYLPQLDVLVRSETARQFLESSQRVRGRHVCRDTHCCPRGMADMLARPARHALYQRAREIERLGRVPSSARLESYLDNVRRVSDEVAVAAGFEKVDPDFRIALTKKQKYLGNFRDAVAHLASSSSVESIAVAPLRRNAASR